MAVQILTKHCSHCKEIKPISEFYKHRTNRDGYNGLCKLCAGNYSKQYKRFRTLHVSNGRRIYGLNKPPYPSNNCCPYCGKNTRLAFHHWDDSNYNDGIWLCRSCHFGIEGVMKSPILLIIITMRLKSHIQ